MNRLCVYCGSSTGLGNTYVDAAKDLGRHLATAGVELVYGGANKGIMGVLADTVLEGGGKVRGVIPHALLEKEVAHQGLTELHVVDSMHDRKSLMAALADGFVALPGGYGTLEEIIEVLTWGQLQFHDKPCGLLNIGGYFNDLLAFLDRGERDGFIRSEHRGMLLVADTPVDLWRLFESYQPPVVRKWSENRA